MGFDTLRMVRKAAIALPVVALAACGSAVDPGAKGRPTPITELPRALSPAETEMISASNRFGFDLLSHLTDGDNLFMSPLSAHLALGMALNGAQDSTFVAMRDVLGFEAGASMPDVNRSYADLLALLVTLDPAVQIDIANGVFYEERFPFASSYLGTLGDVFDAEVGALDFQSPAALNTINGWVEDKTSGRIKKMLDEIGGGDVMFLLNAIYFKGDWTDQFDRDRTYTRDFHLGDGSTQPVDMMVRAEGELEVASNATFDVMDLPYGGGAFRMTIVLPAEGVSLASRLDGLDAATWDSWISGLHPSQRPLEMPRFSMTWERDLNQALADMGMGIAFVPGQANFGAMLDAGFNPQTPGTDLHITKVKQKSFVEVNEEGTEAAAATSVGIGVTSVPVPLVVDRPFLFAIRERLSGTVLFLGVVEDPSS